MLLALGCGGADEDRDASSGTSITTIGTFSGTDSDTEGQSTSGTDTDEGVQVEYLEVLPAETLLELDLGAPSTLDFTTKRRPGYWFQPRWSEVWFPDAFVGPMADLLCALEQDRPPAISGDDNLKTMALVDACYRSAREHRAVSPSEITESP